MATRDQGPALARRVREPDAALRAADVRSHAAREDHEPKLIDLRTSLKEREEPIGNATINTLFAALSAAYSYFIEQGWCSENPLKFIRDLEVAERPFLWLQSAGEVQKLLSACNENIRTLVAVLVGTGMRLDEALHLMWNDIDCGV